ncbi:nucleotide exchange factor GrpE [Clostridium collagenovorans]|uniref:nucleotide exchange factor GrpE n=1 Tax=Clostridium collagenovorans TaxID=29357 RepID=UPI0009327DC6|nr:nucleotide exchange factor GrpE [Clostridium collagenovorans]
MQVVDNKESKLNEECKENTSTEFEVGCDAATEECIEETEATSEETSEEVLDFTKVLKDKVAALEEEVKLLNNKLETAGDRFIKLSAEYDNFRKRTNKEKENIYTDACADVLKEFLPVLDNLERSVAVGGDIEDFKTGIEMVIRGFKDSLVKLNVEEVESEGEFDPNLHNAVMHIEDSSLGANQIVEVFLKGYKRGDKVLRYSMVKVAN